MSYHEDYVVEQKAPVQLPTKVDYSNLAMKQMYEVMKEPKEDNEYKTFRNFLQFKSYLDFTERLERDGVITINRPQQEVIEVEEKKKSPVWAVIAIGFVLVKIGMLIA